MLYEVITMAKKQSVVIEQPQNSLEIDLFGENQYCQISYNLVDGLFYMRLDAMLRNIKPTTHKEFVGFVIDPTKYTCSIDIKSAIKKDVETVFDDNVVYEPVVILTGKMAIADEVIDFEFTIRGKIKISMVKELLIQYQYFMKNGGTNPTLGVVSKNIRTAKGSNLYKFLTIDLGL